MDSFVDIVSKNGNLLLNVPPHADGTLDEEVENILTELGRWMKVNGEAIYGSRPWKVFGEGDTSVKGGHFKERTEPFTSSDIRFTSKGNIVYAIVLDWPGAGAAVTIRSLADKQGAKDITNVKLLGHKGKLNWQRNQEGLKIQMPPTKPCDYAFAFKILVEKS